MLRIYKIAILVSLVLILVMKYQVINKTFLFNKSQPFEEIPLDFKTYLELEQTDHRLVNYVKDNLLTQPPLKFVPYNFTDKILLPKLVKMLLNTQISKGFALLKSKNTTGGFFVEAGANDGIDASNTLWLEKYYGWKGLLVECNPEVLPKLYSRQRRAYIAGVCLSTTLNAQLATLNSVNGWTPSSSFNINPAIFPNWKNISFTTYQVKQIPLYTLIASLDIEYVDFISLDIQSLELKVLKNFPFNLIRVKAWLIEVGLLSIKEHTQLRQLMKQNNYISLFGTFNDEVYLHKYY